MGKLIDADAFLERVLPLCEHPDSLREMVEKEPAVDAVRVVRCKDCVNKITKNDANACRFWNVWKPDYLRTDDGYCHYGKVGD